MTFVGQFKEGLGGYLRRALPYYFVAGLLLVLGVTFGAVAVNALTTQQKADLLEYLQVFLRGVGEKLEEIDSAVVLKQSAANHLKTVGLIWLLGATVIGSPLVVVIVFVRGFVIGFSVGFLLSEMGAKGFLLSVLAVFPQNTLVVPAVLAAAVSAWAFGLLVVRRRVGRFRINLAEEFLAYSFTCLVAGAATVGASLIEAYVTPVFLALLGGT